MKTAVVIDSTFYLESKKIDQLNVSVVPLTVHIDNIVYTEKYDDGKQNIELFERIFENKKLAKTSQPTTESAMKKYEELIAQGYEKIISLHLSSGISGTYQGMCIAAQQVMEDHDNIQIEVFDTKLAAQLSSLVLMDVCDILKKDGDIDVEEVQDIINHYQKESTVFFIVDNLDFLAYGGRINSQIASLGNLFGVQPVLTWENGKIEKFSTIRSKKKLASLITNEFEKVNDENMDLILLGVYTTSNKTTNKLVKLIDSLSKRKFIDREISAINIVIANHLGPDAAGIGWAKKYRR